LKQQISFQEKEEMEKIFAVRISIEIHLVNEKLFSAQLKINQELLFCFCCYASNRAVSESEKKNNFSCMLEVKMLNASFLRDSFPSLPLFLPLYRHCALMDGAWMKTVVARI
jgi:hypothetical protein